MISAFILIVALSFIVIGMPVAFAIGIASMVYFLLPTTFPPDSIAVQRIVASSQSFPLLSVPLFILVGHLMNGTGITPRLTSLATTLAGWMRGGLGQTSLVLSALMGGISGSAVADTASYLRVQSTSNGYALPSRSPQPDRPAGPHRVLGAGSVGLRAGRCGHRFRRSRWH